MKRLALLLTLPACLEDAPVTEDDVIERLSLAPNVSGELVADGVTPIAVELCVHGDPGLAATLRASAGRWRNTEAADPRSIAVKMGAACETRELVPSAELGPLTVLATVADFSRSATEPLLAPRVTRVRAGVLGTLSATASSMIVVSAALDVNDGQPGLPSKGTDVEFTAQIEPDGAVGYLGESVVQIADGNTARTTFFATAAVAKVTFVATARPADRAAVSSAPIAVQR